MKPAALAVLLALLPACVSAKGADRSEPTPNFTALPGDTIHRVIALKHAEAPSLANVLNAAIKRRSDAQVVADARTNSVVVTCAPSELAGIEKLIADLDISIPQR